MCCASAAEPPFPKINTSLKAGGNRLSVRGEERLFGFDALVRDPVYAFYHHGGLVYLLHMDKTSWVETAIGEPWFDSRSGVVTMSLVDRLMSDKLQFVAFDAAFKRRRQPEVCRTFSKGEKVVQARAGRDTWRKQNNHRVRACRSAQAQRPDGGVAH